MWPAIPGMIWAIQCFTLPFTITGASALGAPALDAQTRDGLVIIGEDPSALHYVRGGKEK